MKRGIHEDLSPIGPGRVFPERRSLASPAERWKTVREASAADAGAPSCKAFKARSALGGRGISLLGPIAILLFLITACGGSAVNQGENYGNLLDTPAGLVLTEGEHPDGWGRSDCTLCHNLENIHLVNRTGLAIDIAAIHSQVLAEGIAGCATCHGSNRAP